MLISRLLLELREFEQKNGDVTTSPVFVTVPMDANGLLTVTGTLDDADQTSQTDPSHIVDVFDNERPRNCSEMEARVTRRDETRVDASERYLPPGNATPLL
ncbi:hypothetical protein K439DRAFT_1637080 [Ramaria rubella]|nr:hypothetical protein K439DRAFT_1637080 [Ramaria rubella]